MNVRLIAISQVAEIEELAGLGRKPTPEDLMVYCARVSSPQNQTNLDTGSKLLSYCIRNGHWSVFEQASMTVEITTSRAISAQILRHRSFSFQEFSQRYAKAGGTEPVELRLKGSTNRQGSIEDHLLSFEWNGVMTEAGGAVDEHIAACSGLYESLLDAGVAPECARMVLPMCTQTRLYMTGSVRSWIHYLKQRLSSHAQKEHRLVAEAIAGIFADQFPITHRAVFDAKATT